MYVSSFFLIVYLLEHGGETGGNVEATPLKQIPFEVMCGTFGTSFAECFSFVFLEVTFLHFRDVCVLRASQIGAV